MQTRRLGNSELQVSVIGLGCNNFGMRIDAQQTQAVVDASIDAGITLFDTADIYGGTKSEEFLGQALAGGKRQKIVLATKFGIQIGDDPAKGGGSRRWIMQAAEDSLRRLNTDYIDLYQFHRPDPQTPMEETLRALDDLVQQGKVRHIGNSNFSADQIAEADGISQKDGLARFVSAQNELSLLKRQAAADVLPACEQYGLGFLPFFPLASGMLTGKYHRGEAPAEGTRMAAWGARAQSALSDENFDLVEKLEGWAKGRGHTILELAFAWLLGFPAVSSVIAGATSPEQVRANAATAQWSLTAADMAEIEGLLAA